MAHGFTILVNIEQVFVLKLQRYTMRIIWQIIIIYIIEPECVNQLSNRSVGDCCWKTNIRSVLIGRLIDYCVI
jgi:hypothetical protein